MKTIFNFALFILCIWHSDTYARGYGFAVPEFVKTLLSFLIFIGITLFLIKKFSFHRVVWGIGIFILIFGIFTGKIGATLIGAAISCFCFAFNIKKNKSLEISPPKKILVAPNFFENENAIDESEQKIISSPNETSNIENKKNEMSESNTLTTHSNFIKNNSSINFEYFNSLDRHISHNSHDWVLEKDGLVNIYTKKFIPKSQLREVEIDGVNGCLILDSFIYGIDFIPSNKIKIT